MPGWTSSALIELADRRTERRGTKTLNLQAEFIMALQEFCLESRWEWRRKMASFTMQAGVWSYDLSTVTTASDFHQFVKHGVKYYPNNSQPKNWAEITPMFERERQRAAVYSNTNLPQPAPPQQYFLLPPGSGDPTLALVPVPDQPYPITLDYWAVPNLDSDALPEVIPLVPPFLHHVLLKKLEAEIYRYTIGEGTTKFQVTMGRYQALVDKYQVYDSMVPGEQIDYSGDGDYDSSWSTGSGAVQSTT